jgi:hypothetical protein
MENLSPLTWLNVRDVPGSVGLGGRAGGFRDKVVVDVN